MNYLERPVFTFDIDWNRRPSARFEFNLRQIEIGFGPPEFAPLQEHVVHGFQFEVLLKSAAEIAAIEAFFDEVKGRLRGFWLPGPQEAFRIAEFAGVTMDTTEFEIEDQGLKDSFGSHPATHVLFTKPGQSPKVAQILVVTPQPNGRELVTVSHVEVVDETWQAWPLHYVRLAQDVEQATFEAEGMLVYSLRVVELPTEYLLAETGQRPVYGYHLSYELGGVSQHWHFTSHPVDVTLAGQAYAARRISHASLTRSTRADREEVQIEALYEPENPLSWLFPLRLSAPLWVEIVEGNLADGLAPVTLFRGLALSTSVQGRKQVVRCASAMDALRSGLPGMLIQPRCNYRLFEPGTCGLDREAFAIGVTVDTLDGRTLTVVGSGLAGKGANHFAEGWVEVGSGDTLEVRTILQSGAESGGKVTLTLNAPLVLAEVGVSAILFPGCDGRDVTCASKFGNFLNWGGHRVPLRNLTLNALNISAGAGGKK
jgi:hypothetical protein